MKSLGHQKKRINPPFKHNCSVTHKRLLASLGEYRKIHITGNAGAGKSTLAKYLGQSLEIEVFGLDKIVWQPYYKPASIQQRNDGITDLLKKPEWVIEGVSSQVRSEANIIIFIDLPRRVSIWRCMRRSLPYLFLSRPDMPKYCPEILILPRLLKMIINFPNNTRPAILSDKPRSTMFIHISSTKELKQFVDEIKASLIVP